MTETNLKGQISIRNVTKIYDPEGVNVMAVDDCSLEIAAGEVCMIVGPSGCGKSTLLRALAGLIEGTAEKFVTDFKTPAFVFQDPTLMPWRTVRDNVVLPLELKGSSDGRRPRFDMLSIQETIECVGLNSDDQNSIVTL